MLSLFALLLSTTAAVDASDVILASTSVSLNSTGAEFLYGSSSDFRLMSSIVTGDIYVYKFEYSLETIVLATAGAQNASLLMPLNPRPDALNYDNVHALGINETVASFSIQIVDADGYTPCFSGNGCLSATTLIVTGQNFSINATYSVNVTYAMNELASSFAIIMTCTNVTGWRTLVMPPVLRIVLAVPGAVTEIRNDMVSEGAVGLLSDNSIITVPEIVLEPDDGTRMTMIDFQSFESNTLFSKTITIPHGLATVSYPFTRIAVRMTIPTLDELYSNCWYPVSTPTCSCHTVATVDLYPTTFVITGYFDCVEFGVIYLTPVNSTPQGLPNTYVGWFPSITTTAFTDIAVTTTWTTLPSLPSTTTTTTSTNENFIFVDLPAKKITSDPAMVDVGGDQFPPTRLLTAGDVYVYYFEHPLIDLSDGSIMYLLLGFSRHYSSTVPSFEATLTIVDSDRFAECFSTEMNCSLLTEITVSNDVYRDGNYTEIEFALQSVFSIVDQAFVIVRIPNVAGNVVVPVEARLQFQQRSTLTALQETFMFPVSSNNQVVGLIENTLSLPEWTSPSLIPRTFEAVFFIFHGSFPIVRADMMTITIAVPRAVSSVEPFNRRLIRMSVINSEESTCMFPLHNNVCLCTTLATVDVNSTMFLIEGRFACSFRATSPGIAAIILTRISNSTSGNPMIDGFPDIIPTALTDIVFYANVTSFVNATTTTTTATTLSSASTASTTILSTSTASTSQSSTATASTAAAASTLSASLPTLPASTSGPLPFNASDNRVESLGGAAVRIATYSVIGGAAVVAVIVVVILSCVL
jgi:hypothetical protein